MVRLNAKVRTLVVPYCAATLVLSLVCPWLWQGYRDAYVGYSGTVVEKGDYLWVPFRGVDWYIVLEDSKGHRTKRYVSAYGAAYCHVGDYVVKKKGFGEFPKPPGALTPSAVHELVNREKTRGANQNSVSH